MAADDVPPDVTGRPDLAAVEAFAAARLAAIEADGLKRELHSTARLPGGMALRGGRKLISFCDNDYLGLSTHPWVTEAAVAAAREYGAGAGGSRLVTGDNPLNHQLEGRLALSKGLPAARVFGSGYLANIGTIPALVGVGELVIIDELVHACLHAGAKLSGADVRLFPHNDIGEAARLMRNARGRILLVTETVFSMDGDLAPLAELAVACRTHGAWLMTDDAHGLGVVDIDNPAPIQAGTLSKAVGAYGGYVAGPKSLIDFLASRARSFVYSTGLPPPVLAAALAAFDVMASEPDLRERCLFNAQLFADLIGQPKPASAIVPVILGSAERAMQASRELEERGFLVTAIRPPTVPEGASRLRFTLSATHQEEDIRNLAAAVNAILASASLPA